MDFGQRAVHRGRSDQGRVLPSLSISAKAILKREVAEFSCLAGTLVQEAYATHPQIREACDACISDTAAMLEADTAEAMKRYGVRAKWSAQSLVLHAAASVDHLHRYVELLFNVKGK